MINYTPLIQTLNNHKTHRVNRGLRYWKDQQQWTFYRSLNEWLDHLGIPMIDEFNQWSEAHGIGIRYYGRGVFKKVRKDDAKV